MEEDIMRRKEAKVAAYGRAWPKTHSFQIDMESTLGDSMSGDLAKDQYVLDIITQ
jgi:hypothetical protein